jgi:integrase
MNEGKLRRAIELLDDMGLTVDDFVSYLATGGDGTTGAPTISDYLVQVRKTLTPGTLRGYNTHFRRFEHGIPRTCDCVCNACLAEFAEHGKGCCSCNCTTCRDSALDWPAAGHRPMRPREFTRTELDVIPELARRHSRKNAMNDNRRRAAKGKTAKPDHGQGGQEMAVAAIRCLFERAIDDELVDRSPAVKLDKGARGETKRQALSADQVDELLITVVTAGDDPELDLLITWTELEMLARRGGVLDLTVGAVHTERQTANLREKGRKDREQPLSVELLDALLAHAARRGGSCCVPGHVEFDPNAKVLYFTDSTIERPHPLTSRRFDTLHDRIQTALPWANEMMYTGHVLRHTTGTIVDRLRGPKVAAAMLGHRPRRPTDGYTQARLDEIVEAHSVLTGKTHPLSTEKR